METPNTPGWYDDPEAPEQLRYFDGVVWTRHTAPRTTRWAPPAQTSPQGSPAAGTEGAPPVAAADGPADPGKDPYGWRGASGTPPVGGPQSGGQSGGPAGGPNPWAAPPQGQQPPYGQPGPQQPYGQAGPQQPYGQQQWGSHPVGQVDPAAGWNQPAWRASGPTTPDGVPLAGYWQRVGALVIDNLITSILTGIFGGYFLLRALRPWIDEFTSALNSSDDPQVFEDLANSLGGYLTGPDFFIFALISVLVGLIYHVFFLTRFGATPGKMALRISVRERERSGPLPVAVAVRRYLITLFVGAVGFVPGLLNTVAALLRMIDLLWPAWDGNRQALHDKIAGTNVVRGKQPRRPREPRGPQE